MSASSSALGDAAFAALPKTVQAKIDNAFTSISRSNLPYRQTHSESASASSLAGGFILEDAVVAETDAQRTTIPSARIPLASIPAALELLDLPPHDRQILAVFRDAAESDDDDDDDTAGYGANGADGKEASVSRSQWRAVCAVLLEGSSPSPSPSSPSSHTSPSSAPRQREERNTRPRRSKAAYAPISAHPADADTYESGDDSEPYVASDNSDHSLQQDKDQYDDDAEDGDDSDDEYTGHAASPSKPSKSTKSAKKSASKAKANAVPDSPAALDAFALFFPSTPRDSNELKQKKITLRDLQAAMKSAGEKYKADDLTEMLALFSTSPDKSVSFADFANIMAATGLA
ncbi:hypothetical protein PC9H_005984 [Pleurotus ostreatus]|uniref:Uncharacterized protein n=1 Tax=Pleurotus ostreatus TaxID=5322 RepID=A0A8H6ZVE7_PLEOS|nr:uncharacterized protein PC9H_005984 [Pleurotus ostreatus]KAF7430280.1 hypothetical protein PC9H_005984 [Pleurotus ostreatus]KAJ8701378.1 hypothetical protein PTI98_000172 [Pleurotus ostreatus]